MFRRVLRRILQSYRIQLAFITTLICGYSLRMNMSSSMHPPNITSKPIEFVDVATNTTTTTTTTITTTTTSSTVTFVESEISSHVYLNMEFMSVIRKRLDKMKTVCDKNVRHLRKNALNPSDKNGRNLRKNVLNPSDKNGRNLRKNVLNPSDKNGRNLRNNVINPLRFFWFPSEAIAYCPIFKSATSTWQSHLSEVVNFSEEIKSDVKSKYGQHRDRLLHLGAVNPSRTTWNDYISRLPVPNNFVGFIIVRHPFERLVSAFRDKLERNNLEEPFYYNKFGKPFVQKYRKKAIEVLGEEYFNEANNYGTPIQVKDDRRPNSDLPSFWEFSQAVIDGYKIDDHWRPIVEHCSICNTLSLKAYNYILKFEELEKEEDMFLIHTGWDKKIKSRKKVNVNDHQGLSGDELTQIYFSVLSKKQIRALYSVYKMDFLLFDYSFKINELTFPP